MSGSAILVGVVLLLCVATGPTVAWERRQLRSSDSLSHSSKHDLTQARRHLRLPNDINLGYFDLADKEEEDDNDEDDEGGGGGKDIVQRNPAQLTVPETKKERKKLEKETSSPALRPHVIGGTEVGSAGSYPWFTVVVLETRDGFRYNCGGSLIAPQWVMTSAQCLLQPTPKEVDIMAALENGDEEEDEEAAKFKRRNRLRDDLAGVLVRFFSTSDRETINAGGIPIRGLNYTVHPDVSMTLLRFNGPTNDVALVELERPVRSTELPLALPVRPDNGEELLRVTAESSEDMTFVGAGAVGRTADGELEFPETIQQISMTSLPPDQCRLDMGDTGNFFPPSLWDGPGSALCAVSEDQEPEFGETTATTSTGPCTGDGGSPIFVGKDTDGDGEDDELVVVGLFSLWFGPTCTRKTAPDLFTTVASVYAWIQLHVCQDGANDDTPDWCLREPRPEYVQLPTSPSSEAAPALPGTASTTSLLLRRRICMESSTFVGKVESSQNFFGRIKNKQARRYQPCSWLRQDVTIQRRREKWCLSLMSNAASVCPVTCGPVVEEECKRLAAEEEQAEQEKAEQEQKKKKKERKQQQQQQEGDGQLGETDRGNGKKKKSKQKQRNLRFSQQQQQPQERI